MVDVSDTAFNMATRSTPTLTCLYLAVAKYERQLAGVIFEPKLVFKTKDTFILPINNQW